MASKQLFPTPSSFSEFIGLSGLSTRSQKIWNNSNFHKLERLYAEYLGKFPSSELVTALCNTRTLRTLCDTEEFKSSETVGITDATGKRSGVAEVDGNSIRVTSDPNNVDLRLNATQASEGGSGGSSTVCDTSAQVVTIQVRGKNYERNKAARERRKRQRQEEKLKGDVVKKEEPLDPLAAELKDTWVRRKILENRRQIAKDEAYLKNLEKDKCFFSRSYDKYKRINEADSWRAQAAALKSNVFVDQGPLYTKAIQAGFAKTVVSTIKSGITTSDALSSSISPLDSVSVAERDSEKYKADRRIKHQEELIKKLQDEAFNQQKKSDATIHELYEKIHEMEEQKKAAFARSNARRSRMGTTGWEYA